MSEYDDAFQKGYESEILSGTPPLPGDEETYNKGKGAGLEPYDAEAGYRMGSVMGRMNNREDGVDHFEVGEDNVDNST